MLKAIFFDLDDTLHDFTRASGEAMAFVYEKIAGKYGIRIAQLKLKYGELLRQAEENAFLDGRLSTEYRLERFRNLLLAFGIHDDKFARELVQLYGRELENRLHPLPGTDLLLRDLGQRYKLYLITDGPSDAQRRTLGILGLKDYFKQIFISGELKKKKETGELFKHAVDESGLQPYEIMLVGDSYKRDVLGALKAGLKVIWFNRKNEKAEEDQLVPEIKSLNELRNKLKKPMVV